MHLTFARAEAEDARAVTELRVAVARDLTARFGRGHWSSEPSEQGVLSGMRQTPTWVARQGPDVVATFRLGTRKPWAIDRSYFSASERPLYLTDMAVRPDSQRRGIGRRCLDEAVRIARDWPADGIRLDAYDADAGAGPFYGKCGFREVGRASYRGVPLIYYELML